MYIVRLYWYVFPPPPPPNFQMPIDFLACEPSTCMRLNPHQNLRRGWYHETSLSPQVSRIFFVIDVLCLSCFLVCSLQPCGYLLGKGWPLSSLACYVLMFFLSLSHVVSRVRFGTWLYWFPISDSLLTLQLLKLWVISSISPNQTWNIKCLNPCHMDKLKFVEIVTSYVQLIIPIPVVIF